jgi:hypothetical protein
MICDNIVQLSNAAVDVELETPLEKTGGKYTLTFKFSKVGEYNIELIDTTNAALAKLPITVKPDTKKGNFKI